MMMLGFFALRPCADSADKVALPAGDSQGGRWDGAGRFNVRRQCGQVMWVISRVLRRIPAPRIPQATRPVGH